MKGDRPGLALLASLCAMLLGPPPGLTAQGRGPLLPADHWVRPVLQRLDALGALPLGLDPAAGGWTRVGVIRALDAVSEDGSGGELPDRLAASALSRLRGEWIGEEDSARETRAAARRVPGWVALGWHRAGNELLASYDTVAGGPRVGAEEKDVGNARLAGRAGAELGERLSGEVVVALRDDGRVQVETGHLLVSWKAVGLWGGRRRARLMPVAGRPGLVLAGGPALDAVGVTLVDAIRLPSPFRWLGPVSADFTVSRLGRAGPTADPWFWSAYGSVRPHPRLRVAVERAAMFGGGGNEADPLDVLGVLFGLHTGEDSEVDNQIFALDVWYRLPWEAAPLVAYVSYGMDDSAGAWYAVPAFLFGLELAAVPGAPRVSLSLEHTTFSGSCCGNPPWYRHLQLPWVNGRALLGHPLGGHGSEWRLRARGDGLPGTGWTRVELYVRDRGAENLAVPLRTGTSFGADAASNIRPDGSRFELLGSASVETDGSWTAWHVQTALRLWF